MLHSRESFAELMFCLIFEISGLSAAFVDGRSILGGPVEGREFIPRYRRQDLWIALVVCDWLAPVYVCVPLLITFRMGFCAIKLDAVFHKDVRRNTAHAVQHVFLVFVGT